jgi:hypothetical protein
MADQDSPDIEEHSDSGLNQSQWQISFDAAANDRWSQSATKKESGTAEVNPPPTWGGLARCLLESRTSDTHNYDETVTSRDRHCFAKNRTTSETNQVCGIKAWAMQAVQVGSPAATELEMEGFRLSGFPCPSTRHPLQAPRFHSCPDDRHHMGSICTRVPWFHILPAEHLEVHRTPRSLRAR